MAVDFFKPGHSFLHRFDPRAKLLLLVVMVVCFFLPVGLVVPAVYVACLAALIAAALGPAELLRPLAALGPVLLLICLLTPPFHTSGAVILRVLGLPLLTWEGIVMTLTMLERFLGISLAFLAVFRSIGLDELVLALRWFGLPYSSALVVIIAFRYIPTLGQTYRSAVDAHRLRAASPEAPPRRPRRLRAMLPVLTSVLIQAVRGMPVLAMALECRGFGRSGPRTTYGELKKGAPFAADLCVACAVALAVLSPLLFLPGGRASSPP
jgi:energy-coupling factor transport system permease protein